jgi:hypothetical protein
VEAKEAPNDMHSEKSVRLCLSVLASITLLVAQPAGHSVPPSEGDSDRGSSRRGGSPSLGRTPTLDSYSGRGAGLNSASEHVSALGFISKYARDLGKKRGKEIPELLPLTDQIQKDVKFLQLEWSNWNRKYGTAAPAVSVELDPYYGSLVADSKTLKQAQKLSGVRLLESVRNIARDIQNKATNCRNSADGLGKQISVTARTVQGNAEVPGFEIFYAPMALLGEKGEHKRFPALSSPTTHNNIPPGFYAIWLKRENSTNAYIAQDILSDRSGKCHLDIVVAGEFFASR